MAIKRIMPIGWQGGGPGGGKQKFSGISSDEKPLARDISRYPDGSTLHFVDTGEEFVFHDGMWEDDLRLKHALGEV